MVLNRIGGRSNLDADACGIAQQKNEQHNLGESQRGMMHYYAGLKTKRLEVLKEPLPDCKWLLVQTKFNEGEWQKLPPGNWQLTWKHIHRQKEIYWLYRKTS